MGMAENITASLLQPQEGGETWKHCPKTLIECSGLEGFFQDLPVQPKHLMSELKAGYRGITELYTRH